MLTPELILVCFAVREEARFFHPPANSSSPVEVLISGMGRHNAATCIRRRLETNPPDLVLTCGFAGGLNPRLNSGAVVFAEDLDAGLGGRLKKLGAVPVQFHCAARVAVTAAEKHALWQSTRADAVEMESDAIRNLCRQREIPSATVRVISDTAAEDLPLDFNALMTAQQKINFAKLAWQLARSPAKIPRLVELQRTTTFAARQLGHVLQKLLEPSS